MLLDDLATQILAILPNAEFGEDSEGQLVISTGLRCVSTDGHLVEVTDELG